jgi:beta-N-acetylhexosaminidase
MRILALLFAAAALQAAAPPRKQSAPAARPAGSAAVSAWARQLTLREQVAQLVMVPFYGEAPNPRSKQGRELTAMVRDLRVGGLIVLNRVRGGNVQRAEPYAMAAFLNRMQRLAKVPLIVGGDFERGSSMRMNGTPAFPHLMAYGAARDLEATRALGRVTAREARAMGVHWVFAPDADVNNNPDNPIINIRSFSENPQAAAAQVTAFIEGARSDARFHVLLTVKHFPGHGDTATDTHIGLGTVEATREHLDQVELVPFRAAIQAGVDSVMTAHLVVPAIEPEPIPATVSKNVLTGLLREELKFQGLITTDAMDMQGLSKQFPPGEAAVRAIEAGVDLLLIPTNPAEAVKAVTAAVQSGRIPRKRIEESLRRVLASKAAVGLDKSRFVDLEAISDLVDTPEDEDQAQSAAEKGLVLVKNDGDALPLAKSGRACVYILSGSRFSATGRDLQDAVRQRSPAAVVQLLDPQLPETEFAALAARAAECEKVVAAAFVASAAYRGNVALAGNYPAFVDALLATGKPVIFVSLGNPYLLRTYPGVAAYLATFSTVTTSELAAAKALFGEVPVTGKLPVTIPGLAEYGFGLTMKGGQ